MIDFNSDISIEHTHKEGRKRKEDEKEKKAYDDPQEVAENASAGPAGPSIVDAADLTGGSSA